MPHPKVQLDACLSIATADTLQHTPAPSKASKGPIQSLFVNEIPVPLKGLRGIQNFPSVGERDWPNAVGRMQRILERARCWTRSKQTFVHWARDHRTSWEAGFTRKASQSSQPVGQVARRLCTPTQTACKPLATGRIPGPAHAAGRCAPGKGSLG